MAAIFTSKQRRSIRLKNYIYTQAGAYFLTICTHNRRYLFGEISDHKMNLNQAGRMVVQRWMSIPLHFPSAELDLFVVMPNHFHGIIVLADQNHGVPESFSKPVSGSIPTIIRSFKSAVSRQINQETSPPFTHKCWQRNYWEHVIRNEAELQQLREYIVNNPQRWESDQLR